MYTIGFKKVLGLRPALASGLAAAITGLYVGLAMVFIR